MQVNCPTCRAPMGTSTAGHKHPNLSVPPISAAPKGPMAPESDGFPEPDADDGGRDVLPPAMLKRKPRSK
jgi:hypothetical protein